MKILKISDGIHFDNGLSLTDYHEQDCCENVYADWPAMQLLNSVPNPNGIIDISDFEFDENILDSIKIAPDEGFIIESLNNGRILVPCYDVQNGYYSNNLSLTYDGKNIDISGSTKCNYD